MEKKVLYDARADVAMQLIYDCRRDAKLMSDLIASYNSQPMVAPITKVEEAKAFLKAPVAFLDAAIIRDSGLKFEGAKPQPRTLARMFDLDYDLFVQRVNQSRVKYSNLSHFTFDELTRKVEMSATAEDEIKESVKLYISDGDEQKEFEKIQGLADVINGMCDQYKIDGTLLNRVPGSLPFFITAPKQPGPGWMLKPNPEAIKKALGTPNK